MSDSPDLKFRIPDAYREILRQWAELDSSLISQAASMLESQEPTLSPKNLVEALASKPGVSEEMAGHFLSILINGYLRRDQEETPVGEIASDIVSQIPDLKPGSKKGKAMADAISRILQADKTFGFIAKSASVVLDEPKVFQACRILTDMRPVFSPSTSPLGMAVVHQLRVTYIENGESKSFYCSLTRNDIEELEKTIDRAKTKVAKLKKALRNVTVVDA